MPPVSNARVSASGWLKPARGLADGRTLLSWNPSPVAKQNKVEISASDSRGV